MNLITLQLQVDDHKLAQSRVVVDDQDSGGL
jgi:hypothetical protein